jgi:hypothetical protein
MHLRACRWLRLASLGCVALSVSLIHPGHATAQRAVTFEPRLGVTLPLGDLAGDRAETGMVAGVEGRMELSPRVSAWAALNRHGFRCPQACPLAGDNPRSTGFAAGLRLAFPSYQEAVWWGRVGAVSHRFTSASISGGMEWGVEVAGGVDIPVNQRLGLTPSAGAVGHQAGDGLNARYLIFGVGLHYHLR